jgi:uncharacterized DUF497 family protein
MRFEWDGETAAANAGKHRVSFEEAITVRLLKEGASIVVLDPDGAKAFRTSAAVNEALRSLLTMSESTRRLDITLPWTGDQRPSLNAL